MGPCFWNWTRKILALVMLLHSANEILAQPGVKEVRVGGPTRLDWEFAVAGFGPGSVKLPAGFDSKQQSYQLHVPAKYQATKAWPLVVFISPSDSPGGWTAFQKVCEQHGSFFCAPAKAGNQVAAGPRSRIILDAVDDVRRNYRIDPDQTYVAGFSGGGRMACTLAFNLPEYFAGAIPICGTNPLPTVTYLRHRLQERSSVAFITGETDFNRKENEDYMAPYLQEVGIRSRLWVVPKLGHAVPSSAVLNEAYTWLSEDLPRRRADGKKNLGLNVKPEEALAPETQADRLLVAAQSELKQPERTWQGIALLQGVVQRWPQTVPGKKARGLLGEITKDETILQRVEVQGSADEVKALSALAKGLERFGQKPRALEIWGMLAKDYAGSPAGQEAAAQAKRIRDGGSLSPALPPAYLGLGLEEGKNVIDQLAPGGPAEKAGLKIGDVLLKIDTTPIKAGPDLAQVMQKASPGQRLALEIRRDERMMTLTVEIGTRPGQK